MSKELIVWQIDRDKFHRTIKYTVFGLLSLAFFILPQFGVDKLEFIIQMERVVGVVHPSILRAANLPDFGSRGALLLLFANFILVFYVIHAFIFFSQYAKTIKQITFFQKIKFIFISLFVNLIFYFAIFFLLGNSSALTVIYLINNNELVFFFFTSMTLTLLILFLMPSLVFIFSIFKLKE